MYTLETLKQELPDVQVKRGGKVYKAHIQGRALPFPQVWCPELDRSYEFAWKTVLNAVNNNTILNFE